MKQRWFWVPATYAAVVATTLTVAFGQAPVTTKQRAAAAEKFRRAAAGKEEEKVSPQVRGERFRKWQEAHTANKTDLAFDQPAEAMTFFLEKRLRPDQAALSPSDYFPALEQADGMVTYSTALQQFVPSRPGAGQVQLSGGPPSPASPSSALPGAWEPVGPGNIGGRTRALLIHPTTPNVMWAAGVAGGIWKSTDAGTSWVPKADLLVNIAVNSMLLDPRNPDVLYAGTGEGFFNIDAVRGAGILKSTDGGETWAQLPSTATPDFHYVQKIVMSKGSSQRLYAATRTGVWRSNDAGATWVRTLDPGPVNGCMDLAIQTDRALAFVFASCGTFAQGSVRRALDTGGTQTWSVPSAVGLQVPNQGRTSLAIAPSNQNVIYALAASTEAGSFNNGLLGVWRSADSGRTWTQRVSNTSPTLLNRVLLSNPVFGFLADCGFGPSNQFLNQGWYDNVIAVDPRNPDIVWVGGIDLFRSDDGGANWGQASHWWFTRGLDPEYNHADHHAIVFHPNYDGTTNLTMYTGNDGGIYRTDDARGAVLYSPNPVTPASPVCGAFAPGTGLGWTGLNNGYETTQFYHGVPYPDGTTFFGGTQDNGTLRGSLASGRGGWEEIRGGDGGYVAVNATNTNMLWVENTGLSIQRSVDGGTNWLRVTSGIGEGAGNFLFITPFAQDPTNPATMWIGGAFPWRASNATGVPAPNPYWRQAGAFFNARIGAWAVAPQDSNRVYAGVGTGAAANTCRVLTTGVGTTATAATVWTSSKVRPDGCFVSWIAPDPATLGTVYATVSTFNTTTGQGHVFKSTDFGATWTSIDGSGATGIPDVPAHTILVDPDDTLRLYVGTDIGVFVSLDGGANWARENTGFANVITEALAINTVGAQKYIYAFTHGRSLFRVLKP